MAHEKYLLLAKAGGSADAEAQKSADILALTLQPKFESACGAANKLITEKLNGFITEHKAAQAKDHARMSLGIANAVKAVHDKYIEPQPCGCDCEAATHTTMSCSPSAHPR